MTRRFAVVLTLAVTLLCVLSLPGHAVALGAGFGSGSGSGVDSGPGSGLSTGVSSSPGPSLSTDVGTESVASGPQPTADAWSSISSGPVASATSSTASPASTDGDDTIRQTAVLRHLPDRPGEFETELSVDVPDPVTDLELTVDSTAEVVSTDGFDHAGGETYEWTGSADQARITFRMPANRTQLDHYHRPQQFTRASPSPSTSALGPGPEPELEPTTATKTTTPTSEDEYYFTDTGSWGVVTVPTVQLDWWQTSSVSVERTAEVDGPGATGGDIAYFGPVTEHTRSAGSESFRLAVPDAVELRESPEDILDSFENASRSLRIGGKNDEVFVVAVPSDDVSWGASGIQYGDSDAWVVADAPLDTPRNVWLHEYVHTRQDFMKSSGTGTTAETQWLVEAQAEYFAALTTLEQERIEFSDFRRSLREGQRALYTRGTLSDRSTWHHEQTDYVKGPLVFGAIDRQLRLETEGERTGRDVVRKLNLREEPVTQDAFLSLLEREGGPDLRAFAERYTQTAQTPDAWSVSDHSAAFDQPTALIDYALADEPIRVSGPTRDASGAVDTVPTLVPGETVTFPVAVENVGERSGTYGATLRIDGTIVDERSGTLEAGDRRVETVSWTPDSPGRYDVRVGDQRGSLEVKAPASGTVTDLAVEPETVRPGENVTATATVTNDEDRPANATVRFRTPAGIADEVTVSLASDETATVETTLRFDDPGRYEVAAGERTVVVSVEADSVLSAVVDEAAEALPGFGVPVTLAGLGAVVALAVVRRRTERR
ncbi:CARDB domain-containing protein [Halomontanus rarus]|uniref:CARDB domain-containing protein n=1 Tax=Halomontanus rarus TaxID=3034020 RepID=UPI001A99F82C